MKESEEPSFTGNTRIGRIEGRWGEMEVCAEADESNFARSASMRAGWSGGVITRSLSRPQVSDDNPFSEAQFKTLKYHPGFPSRFVDIEQATTYCRSFFAWYNTEHRHGGISMLTPDDVHHDRAHAVLAQRQRTPEAAWAAHPERFVRGMPKHSPLPEEVWINPPAKSTTGGTAQ